MKFNWRFALNIFAILMTVVYFGLGVLLLFNDFRIFHFTEFGRIGTGCLLLLYGVFRLYKALSDIKIIDADDEEE